MSDYLLDMLGEEIVLLRIEASSLLPSGKITSLTFDGMDGIKLNVDESSGQNVLESPLQQFVRARMLDSQAAPELMRQMFGHLRNWLNNRIEDEHSRLLVLVPFGLPDEARVLLQNNLGSCRKLSTLCVCNIWPVILVMPGEEESLCLSATDWTVHANRRVLEDEGQGRVVELIDCRLEPDNKPGGESSLAIAAQALLDCLDGDANFSMSMQPRLQVMASYENDTSLPLGELVAEGSGQASLEWNGGYLHIGCGRGAFWSGQECLISINTGADLNQPGMIEWHCSADMRLSISVKGKSHEVQLPRPLLVGLNRWSYQNQSCTVATQA